MDTEQESSDGRESENGRQELGQAGENLAAEMMSKSGLKIVERNYRPAVGEIDIICEGVGQKLLFVEVRSSSTGYLVSSSETVDARKQGQVIRAARWYIQERERFNWTIRFDVVAVRFADEASTMEWIEDAFRPKPSGQSSRFTW